MQVWLHINLKNCYPDYKYFKKKFSSIILQQNYSRTIISNIFHLKKYIQHRTYYNNRNFYDRFSTAISLIRTIEYNNILIPWIRWRRKPSSFSKRGRKKGGRGGKKASINVLFKSHDIPIYRKDLGSRMRDRTNVATIRRGRALIFTRRKSKE